jgi:predicted NAD/FAD-dependent oxidoreductase
LIVGAGVAGLSAARELRRSGTAFLVVEKSRGLGGRAATRRGDHGPVDHGAQFFTARSPEFREQVDDWLKRGVCFEWTRGFHQWRADWLRPLEADGHPRFACEAGMSSLARDLAAGFDDSILRQQRVTALHAEGRSWRVELESGGTITADSVLLTAPAPQAALLLAEGAPDAAAVLAGRAMTPCLALAARYPREGLTWQGIQFQGHPVLGWAGHDTSKRPGRHAGSTFLVLHATPEFSEAHYTAAPEAVTPLLLTALSEATRHDWRQPLDTFLHRWRYAQPSVAAASPPPSTTAPFLSWETPAPLLAAGDALGGGKIEGAWLSGLEAARRLQEL